jgi:hypothetical protein
MATKLTDWDEPHDVKGLAGVLGRHENYVYDMRACGFVMPGGRATLRMAFAWLAQNQDFKRRKATAVRFARRVKTGGNGTSGELASA